MRFGQVVRFAVRNAGGTFKHAAPSLHADWDVVFAALRRSTSKSDVQRPGKSCASMYRVGVRLASDGSNVTEVVLSLRKWIQARKRAVLMIGGGSIKISGVGTSRVLQGPGPYAAPKGSLGLPCPPGRALGPPKSLLLGVLRQQLLFMWLFWQGPH